MADKGLKYHVRYKANGQLPHACSPHEAKAWWCIAATAVHVFLFSYFSALKYFIKKAKYVLRETLLYMGMIPGKSLHHVWSRHINRKTSLLRSIKVDNICFLSIWLRSTPIYLLSQSLFSPEILISFVSHLDPFPSFLVGNWLHRFSFTKLF